MKNNKLNFVGKVTEPLKFNHRMYGENFYSFKIGMERRSGKIDEIPVLISERIRHEGISMGDTVIIKGEFRSHNHIDEDGISHLKLYAFVQEITKLNDVEADFYEDENEVKFKGYLCKEPSYRTTPLGREITDFIFAVNRKNSKSDYIPCLAWSRNANWIKELPIGTEIELVGRVQSRPYINCKDEQKIALEVSVSTVEVI